jgi:hypothetical protein
VPPAPASPVGVGLDGAGATGCAPAWWPSQMLAANAAAAFSAWRCGQ